MPRRPGARGRLTMAGGKVLVARDGAIATVTLSSPGRMNALDKAMWSQLGAAMQELGADEGLRCIVLRGEGDKAFAAGADIAEFANERANSAQAKAYSEGGIGWMHAVAGCRHPTVALIQGACVGGGLLIASQCDLRICSESARFGVPVKNLGLTESYDELQATMRAVGPVVSLELLLEGRIWGAREAYEKGIVNRVVADDKVVEDAYATARRIAEGAPLVARWHKKFVRRLLDPRPLTPEEEAEGVAAMGTEDYRIGVAAFLAKEKPRFRGR
jgi:enoyl-CoA hydratase/carnithine racemase